MTLPFFPKLTKGMAPEKIAAMIDSVCVRCRAQRVVCQSSPPCCKMMDENLAEQLSVLTRQPAVVACIHGATSDGGKLVLCSFSPPKD